MLRRRVQPKGLLRAMRVSLRFCRALVMAAAGVSWAFAVLARVSAAPMAFPAPPPLPVQSAQVMPAQLLPGQSPRPTANAQQPHTPQPATAQAPSALAALPEPIYWKQNLFLIPYQWASAAEPGAARAVWLFVSKDRGASWQKISEAKPDVKAFNYRAEGDGEYWFAVRTFDKQGRAWPQGPYQPELRVIVDTTLPRIVELRTQSIANGSYEILASAADPNLEPSSWKFEWQADPTGPWQPASLQTANAQGIGNAGLLGGSAFHAFWQAPPGVHAAALRGIVMDKAGNSATYQAKLNGSNGISGPLLAAPGAATASAPPVIPAPATQVGTMLPNANQLQSSNAAQGWASIGNAPSLSPANSATLTGPLVQPVAAPATQPWPAADAARAPFQLWTDGTAKKDDGVTTYGNPRSFAASGAMTPGAETPHASPRIEAKYTGIGIPQPSGSTAAASLTPESQHAAALEPYREAGNAPLAVPSASLLQGSNAPSATTFTGVAPATTRVTSPIVRDITPVDSTASPHAPPSPPKLVGSRTFALEYDLDDTSGAGVSKVELWGSRDGGKSWNRYAQDDDNRSPLLITVDEEGLYGFRIVVQTVGGANADGPRPGDSPELWVSVDLKRPIIELTAIERGQGNVADHLILRWRASDNNLEARPISLFYSSRPSGPWSAIATNLQNTGEYSWRVERYVPARFYLRLEARDTAGNLAAYQTREPVEFSPGTVAAQLRSSGR